LAHALRRTFRVFVSSTFSDMKVERNVLARWVFPRLRALCEARGFKFQAVDLRWGVREEAALDQQTVRICLDEIARCQRLSPRPNFIVLLGDRYGWCPLPSTIPADEWDQMLPHLAPDDRRLLEYREGASEGEQGWYRRDDNAVPAEYVLQPRRGRFAEYEVWEPVERRLRGALARAAAAVGLGEAEQRKYRASATELEIIKGALEAQDAREHVFAFFRSIPALAQVAAALPAASAAALVDTLPSASWDEDAWKALQQLKATLAERLGEANVRRYEGEWQGLAKGLDLPGAAADLCEAVWQRLSRVIGAEMKALDSRAADPVGVERRAQDDFATERRRVFVGRREPLARIATYLDADIARPLVVHGPSGSGKSALMARAVADARAAHVHAVIIQRFIGATPGSSEIRPLLDGLSQEVSLAYDSAEGGIGEYEVLVAELPKRLALATADRPLILFLDALDQLGDTHAGRRLLWLPRALPPHVRIVVSTLEEETYHCFAALRAGARDEDLVPLTPLGPDEGRDILRAWLADGSGEEGRPRCSRTLTPTQIDVVIERFAAEGSPLYLKLAFEEARRWHSYPSDANSTNLPADVPGLVRMLFARLSAHHGRSLVTSALGYLAGARYGLNDEELLDLLWRDPNVRNDFEARKRHDIPDENPALPPVVWSRVYFDLEPYLTWRDVVGVRVFSFFHRQLAEVAAEDYVDPIRDRVHGRLADYFEARWRIPDSHAVVEVVRHSFAAGRRAELESLLSNPEFLRAKCNAPGIGVDDLIADLAEAGGPFEGLAAALGADVDLSRRHPELAIQQLWNQTRWLSDLPATFDREALRRTARAAEPDRLFLEARVPPVGGTVQSVTLDRRPSAVVAVEDGLLVFQTGGWLVLGADGTVLRSGDSLPAVIREVAVAGDATAAVVSGVILLWKGPPQGPPFRFSPGFAPKTGALGSGGRELLVGGEDGRWVLYDVARHPPIRRAEGRISAAVTAVTAAGPGQWMLGASDGTIHRLDGGGSRTFDATSPGVRKIEVSADGELIMTLAANELSVHTTSGRLVFRHRGHEITDAVFDARNVLLTTARGQVQRARPEAGAVDMECIATIDSPLTNVRRLACDGTIVVLGDDRILRFLRERRGRSRVVRWAAPPARACAGVLSLRDGTSIAAFTNGSFYRFVAGDPPGAALLSETGEPVRTLHPLASRPDQAVLILTKRHRSLLASMRVVGDQLEFDDLGARIEEDGLTVLGSAVSGSGSLAVLALGTSFPPRRTRVSIFRIHERSKVREVWMEGWHDHPAISDSGAFMLASYEGGSYRRIHDGDGSSSQECPVPGAYPMAFDELGRSLLVLDQNSDAWLVDAPWTASCAQPLRRRARVGGLAPDGKAGVLVSETGFLEVFERAPDGHIEWIGGYPVGFEPVSCALDYGGNQVSVCGHAGFQILRWAPAAHPSRGGGA